MRSSWLAIGSALVLAGAGGMGVREATAQSLGGGTLPSASAGAASAPVTPAYPAAGTYFPLPTQAAPGAVANPAAAGGMSGGQGGLMSSPLAAPLIFNSMVSATTPSSATSAAQLQAATGTSQQSVQNLQANQLGMMMLLANQQNGGIGSGRLSGVRNDPRQQGGSGGTRPAGASAQVRPSNRPGGLASGYFNRASGYSLNRYPRGYFNRRPSSMP